MATLNERMQLARDLFGREPAPGEVRAYARATANSTGGTVTVDIGGEVVDVPVLGAVARGQEVILQVQNGHPVALGVAGWGDNIRSSVQSMQNVLSYVWIDDYGQLRITPTPYGGETGVMINAAGVNVEGYTYNSHTGNDGFTVFMGERPVIQVMADAQSPDFQHNRMRTEDCFYIEADSGGDDPATRTRLLLAESDTASTYYSGNVARLEVDGATKLAADASGNVTAAGSVTADGFTTYNGAMSGRRGVFGNVCPSFYGTCATAAGTQEKAVACNLFAATDLQPGTFLTVTFASAQTYNGQPMLNVNSTGAVPVVRQGTTAPPRYFWLAGETVQFVYDGTHWAIIDGGIATTTYYGMTKLSGVVNSTSNSVAATPGAVKQAYDLAAAAGTWRTVAITVGVPSGFDSRSCTVLANDGARLLSVSFSAENSGGTNVSVPANTSLFTCTDQTLRPSGGVRAGAGFRYNGAALLDFPVKTLAGSPWALIGPAWSFSAASIHFDSLIPYDALGIA